MEGFLKDRKEVKERSEALEKEEESKALTVKSLDSLKEKVAQEKFEEYTKTMRIDPVIEESMLIIKDML